MRLNQIFEAIDSTTTHDAPHWDAFHKTGFFGKQGAGCLFLASSSKRVLLGLRSDQCTEPHQYGLFGGAINEGEDPRKGAEREAREETGYTGSLKLMPLLVFRKQSFSYFNFLALVTEEFTPHLNWENDDAVWCDIGHWPQPLHFGVLSIINDPASMQQIMKFAPNK